jgi:hypothetical protein
VLFVLFGVTNFYVASATPAALFAGCHNTSMMAKPNVILSRMALVQAWPVYVQPAQVALLADPTGQRTGPGKTGQEHRSLPQLSSPCPWPFLKLSTSPQLVQQPAFSSDGQSSPTESGLFVSHTYSCLLPSGGWQPIPTCSYFLLFEVTSRGTKRPRCDPVLTPTVARQVVLRSPRQVLATAFVGYAQNADTGQGQGRPGLSAKWLAECRH